LGSSENALVRRIPGVMLFFCLCFDLLASIDARADAPSWCERYDKQPLATIESLPESIRTDARRLAAEAQNAAKQRGVDGGASLFRLPRAAIEAKNALSPESWLLVSFVPREHAVASLLLYSPKSKRTIEVRDPAPWFEASLSEPQEGGGKIFNSLTYIFFSSDGQDRVGFVVADATDLDAAGDASGPATYSSWLETKAGSEKLPSFCSLQQRHRAPF